MGTPGGALEMVKGQTALTLTEKIHPETRDETRRRQRLRGLEYKVFSINCSKNCRGRAKMSTGERHRQKRWKSELRKKRSSTPEFLEFTWKAKKV